MVDSGRAWNSCITQTPPGRGMFEAFRCPRHRVKCGMRAGLRGNAAETAVEGETEEEICMVNADLCAR